MKDIDFFEVEYEGWRIEFEGYPEEDHRLPRLQRVVGYVQALQDLKRHKEFNILNMVGKLKDHKGTLCVYWSKIPHEADKKVFEDAWESGIANESVVEHEVYK